MSLTPIKYVNEVGVKALGKTIPKVWIGTKEQYEQLDKTTLADNTIVNIVDDYEEYPIQVKEMPIPKEENQIVQYIGQTTSDYTNGFFYKCTQEENNLIWKNISVSNTYIPSNKEVLDKFSENDEGKVLYDNKPLASDNLWHGTQAEYDALGEYDENKTYVITDGGEDVDLSSMVIDDTSTTSKTKTWSAKKINESVPLKTQKILRVENLGGTTQFTVQLSTLNLKYGIYHFKIFMIGNTNITYCAEGGFASYEGNYSLDIAYKSEQITNIAISGETLSVTTSSISYSVNLAIQPVNDWFVL